MVRTLVSVVVFCAICVFLLFVLANWLIGCGEPQYHADGTYLTGECIGIPYEPKQGRWK